VISGVRIMILLVGHTEEQRRAELGSPLPLRPYLGMSSSRRTAMPNSFRRLVFLPRVWTREKLFEMRRRQLRHAGCLDSACVAIEAGSDWVAVCFVRVVFTCVWL
jgi:hypothetical protein